MVAHKVPRIAELTRRGARLSTIVDSVAARRRSSDAERAGACASRR
jgi:hypothetical protein